MFNNNDPIDEAILYMRHLEEVKDELTYSDKIAISHKLFELDQAMHNVSVRNVVDCDVCF